MKGIFTGVAALLLAAGIDANELVKQKFVESIERAKLKRNVITTPPSFREGSITCRNGAVTVGEETYDCENVDFLSLVSAEELLIPGSQYLRQSSDIWGWVDSTGREITILTLDTGVVFLDSSDPEDPCILSKHHSSRPPSPWGDVKVIGHFAYTIKDKLGSETAPGTGMEVYDLSKLEKLDCKADGYEIKLADADHIVPIHGSCHNVVANTETGRVYAVGCRDTCDGGLVIFDVLENPLKPNQIGCVSQDGYTHDAQCVVYDGPDDRYAGKEICLAFNEDTLTIWDVTDAARPIQVSRERYDNQAYSHQGWFNRDMTKVLLDDELDEVCNAEFDSTCDILVSGDLNGELKTSTYVWNVIDLENPTMESVFVHKDVSIDHNLYVWGAIHEKGWGGNPPLERIPNPNHAYLNNYMAGLRILDISAAESGEWTEIGFFDITETTEAEFLGSWSGYMFPSGTYAISSIEKGLFFVKPTFDFVDSQLVSTSFPTRTPTASPSASPSASPTPKPVTEGSSSDVPSASPTSTPVTENGSNVPSASPTPSTETESSSSDDPSASPVLYVMFFLFLGLTVGVGFLMSRGGKPSEQVEGEQAQPKQVSV